MRFFLLPKSVLDSCFSSILYLPLAFDLCRHVPGPGLQMEGTFLTDLKAPWLKDQSISTKPSPCRPSWLRTYMPSLEILSLCFSHFSPRHLLCWKTSLSKVAETDLWFGEVKCLTYCSKWVPLPVFPENLCLRSRSYSGSDPLASYLMMHWFLDSLDQPG